MADHPLPDSDEFRAGMAYAAHILRHAVGAAHGGTPHVPVIVEPHACCREAVINVALGVAEGLTDIAGPTLDHHHEATR